MLNQIDALSRTGPLGQSPGAGLLGPAGGLEGASHRCQGCQAKKDTREMMKAKLDPVGEMARDSMRAKKADLKSKMALLQGDLLGAAFYGSVSQKAQREMGLNVAANLGGPGPVGNVGGIGGVSGVGGIGGVAGVGNNPFLGM